MKLQILMARLAIGVIMACATVAAGLFTWLQHGAGHALACALIMGAITFIVLPCDEDLDTVRRALGDIE